MKNRIESIRKERGIRQEEFAKALGVSRQTISSLENGRYNPSIQLAFKIARHSRRGLVGASTLRSTPISRPPLGKNPMPGHLSELHPVNEVNTKGQ